MRFQESNFNWPIIIIRILKILISSIFLTTFLKLSIVLPLPITILGNHIRNGCLSFHDKKILLKISKSKLDAAEASIPEWCKNNLIPKNLAEKSPENTKPPYLIHTWSYTRSNSIRVKIRTREKNNTESYISEVVIQAREIKNQSHDSISRSESALASKPTHALGQFYPYPTDVELSCCDDHMDHDTARISRKESSRHNSSINFLWMPNGFFQDFEGEFEFVATVANTRWQYWTLIKSHPQIARRSVKLDSSEDFDSETETTS